MQVSEAVARAVALECPGTPIFSLVGDANLAIAGSFARNTHVRQVMVRHEGAAVAMAEGWSRATGKVALASVTSGPGLTHAATSLLAASRSRIPMVIIAGAVPQQYPTGLQAMMNIDQRRLAEACEAEYGVIGTAAGMRDELRNAFYRAVVHRRPVVLDVPLDVQSQEVDDDWTYDPSIRYLPQTLRLPLDPDAAARILQDLVEAERPLIVAGRGAVEASNDLETLADQSGALLGTTLPAKGLFDGNPWSLGIVGGYSSEAGRELIRQADLVLAFGAELGHFTTQNGTLLEGRPVVRIDNRPDEAPLPAAQITVFQADASAAAEALVAAYSQSPVPQPFRSDEVAALLTTPDDLGPAPSDGLLHPGETMRYVSRLLPPNAAIVVGGGHFTSFPSLYLDRPAQGSFILPFGAAAIGQAVPVGVGAAVGLPERPVIVIEGDGSLMMNIQEFETASRIGAKLLVLVMNDGALSAERLRLQAYGYDPSIVMYDSPDFARIAQAFGWSARTVDTLSDLDEAFQEFAIDDRPMLVDVRVSREIVINPVGIRDLSRQR